MKKSVRRTVKTLWLIFVIPATLLLFVTLLPGILWGILLLPSESGPFGRGSTDLLGFYAQFFGPFAILGLITFFLFRYLKQADRQDMQEETLIEASAGITLKEKKIINALTKNGSMTLDQLSLSTGIPLNNLTIEVRQLMARRVVRQDSSPDGSASMLSIISD